MEILKELSTHCIITGDQFGQRDTYRVTFKFDQAVVTIRVAFRDSSGADMAITNMTTLPENERRKGYGTRAIQMLLRCARTTGKFRDIRAVQVQRQKKVESFWAKVGFVPMHNTTNDWRMNEGKSS